MTEYVYVPPHSAEVIHEIPADLAEMVGRVIVAYSKLEHQLMRVVRALLQLSSQEARIALRSPTAADRLDMSVDLLALKAIEIQTDTAALRETIAKATSLRNQIAHGIFQRHPEDGEITFKICEVVGTKTFH